jgi:transposase
MRPLKYIYMPLDIKCIGGIMRPSFTLKTKKMYVDKSTATKNGKKYTRYLLRTSTRKGKKTIKTTILNITPFGEQTCEAIKFALANKDKLTELGIPTNDLNTISKTLQMTQDKPIGDVWLIHQLSTKLGITEALGDSEEGRLALWQIIARTLDQGSRLSAVRLARNREIDFLRLDNFTENDLYKNLDWLADNQNRIEKALYQKRYGSKPCKLFLYDVTSSYFEGIQNELAAFGYNRDGKRSKMQIVVGLLCAEDGTPVAVEVFEGNTNDTKTFHSQVRKVADRFQAEQVIFVGDRGMIKSTQQKELTEENFRFITALTKSQIETLIKQDVVQLELFDEKVNEVVMADGKRYILKCNPVRAEEIAASRQSKLRSLKEFVSKKNEYLSSHRKASLVKALQHIQRRAIMLKIESWVKCTVENREIKLHIDDTKLSELSLLDGCYCLTTNVSVEAMDKESVHARYKDLALVEEAFRTCKTGHLELRPIYVRKTLRTRGHVFVVMLSHLLVCELRDDWRSLDATVEESLDLLSGLCGVRVLLRGGEIYTVPRPRAELARLYKLSGVSIPRALPKGGGNVDTERKLTSRRKLK